MFCEPVGDGHSDAEETQADAVHLRSDGDVGEEGVVTAHEGRAAFKVFHDIKDLLSLSLPHHPSDIQQGGDMLLPVGRKDAGRKVGRQLLGIFIYLVLPKVAMTLLTSLLSHCICFW